MNAKKKKLKKIFHVIFKKEIIPWLLLKLNTRIKANINPYFLDSLNKLKQQGKLDNKKI